MKWRHTKIGRTGMLFSIDLKKMVNFCQSLRTLLGESRGAVAVEFALVIYPFFAFIFAIFTIGFLMYCATTLDYAVQKAGRSLLTGSSQGANITSSQFRSSILCPLLPPKIFDCTKLVINVQSFYKTSQVYNSALYYNFVNTTRSGLIVPTVSAFCPGGGGAYQVIEVTYPLPITVGFLAPAAVFANGQFNLMSSLTLRNEPFGGSTTPSSGC